MQESALRTAQPPCLYFLPGHHPKEAAYPFAQAETPPPISGGPGAPYVPHLEQVVSRRHVGDVDPLAVDVMTVHVPAAHGDALLTKVGTLVTLLDVCMWGQREAQSPGIRGPSAALPTKAPEQPAKWEASPDPTFSISPFSRPTALAASGLSPSPLCSAFGRILPQFPIHIPWCPPPRSLPGPLWPTPAILRNISLGMERVLFWVSYGVYCEA